MCKINIWICFKLIKNWDLKLKGFYTMYLSILLFRRYVMHCLIRQAYNPLNSSHIWLHMWSVNIPRRISTGDCLFQIHYRSQKSKHRPLMFNAPLRKMASAFYLTHELADWEKPILRSNQSIFHVTNVLSFYAQNAHIYIKTKISEHLVWWNAGFAQFICR